MRITDLIIHRIPLEYALAKSEEFALAVKNNNAYIERAHKLREYVYKY